jgi:hypothetical protein
MDREARPEVGVLRAILEIIALASGGGRRPGGASRRRRGRGRRSVEVGDRPVPARVARGLILAGRAPSRLAVAGHLDLSGCPELVDLPGLTADSLDLSGCTGLRALPAGLAVGRLCVNGCTGLGELPAGLRLFELEARQTRLPAPPDDLRVANRLDLSDCVELAALPTGLSVGTLILRGCEALAALPEGLETCFLDVSGCTRLVGWPRRGSLRIGRLAAQGCTGLTELPPWLGQIAQLDLRGCANLRRLPASLRVRSWIDLAGTAVAELPASSQGAQLRWKGVPIDARIAFHPETITAVEVIETRNAELRRVLLERMTYARFVAEARAEVLDRDRDPGGERQLVRVDLDGDEPLVCVAVSCPSTGRQYVLRVPPRMRSCRQAVAWIAGFDDPADYRPVFES